VPIDPSPLPRAEAMPGVNASEARTSAAIAIDDFMMGSCFGRNTRPMRSVRGQEHAREPFRPM